MTDMPTPPPAAAALTPAGIGTRFVARLIDAAIVFGILIPPYVVLIIGAAAESGIIGLLGAVLIIAAIVVVFYVFAWGQGVTGQTPGKRSQGLMLVKSADGQPLGGGLGIGRYLLESILNSICLPISWIWALFDQRNQTLHDKILSAEVVETTKGSITPIFPGGKPF